MKDLTVLIPVRIESIIRLENILAVVKYLQVNFDVRIRVLESSQHDNNILRTLLPKSVEHTFVEDHDPVFYRTKYINDMAKEVRTPFLAVWDADVVFPIRQVLESVEYLRSGNFDVVYPYSGIFLDVSKNIRQMFIESGDLSMLEELKGMMSSLYGSGMKGGAFLVNTKKYIDSGMENLTFYGWGPEDWERYERWQNMGYRITTVAGDLFHLSHPRDMNGMHNSRQQRILSFFQKDIVHFSSAEEIKQEIKLRMNFE